MNKADFTLNFLDRVLKRESELIRCLFPTEREQKRWNKKEHDDWSAKIPEAVFEADAAYQYLMYASMNGVARLETRAVKRLLDEVALGTLIVAAARGFVGDVDLLNATLLSLNAVNPAEGGTLADACERRRSLRFEKPKVSDFRCDSFGHNPRWYAQLFVNLRPRFAAEYRRLDLILKRLGCPAPAARDELGFSVVDYAESVLPRRAEYLAIDISGGLRASRFPVSYHDAAEGEEIARRGDKSDTLLFRLVKADSRHRDAYVGVFPITCGQLVRMVNHAESLGKKGCEFPINSLRMTPDMPWRGYGGPLDDIPAAEMIVSRLRNKTRLASFDIPEWYVWSRACRAGTSTRFNNGSDREADCQEVGWTSVNSGHELHPVGLKRPNALGFYDMHGNVNEFCWWWGEGVKEYGYFGGSYLSTPEECRPRYVKTDCRGRNVVGLRLALYL